MQNANYIANILHTDRAVFSILADVNDKHGHLFEADIAVTVSVEDVKDIFNFIESGLAENLV
jgi:hypothetical protein